MRAFQCDRCNGFYSEKIRIDAELNDEKYNNIRVYHGNYVLLDLCPNCMNSLAKWLKCKEGEVK